jgi:hypothetical protein
MMLSGKEILKAFKSCMYDYDDKKEFQNAFNSLLSKVNEEETNEDHDVDKEEYNTECGGDKDINEKGKIGKKKKRKADRENWLNVI